jgi:hypothetical protein
MADGSLSSVVSSLLRAQMGASVSTSVTYEDLDRHVAELILKEAKKKAEQYDKQGIRAYLPQYVQFFLYLLLTLPVTLTIQLSGKRVMYQRRTSGFFPLLFAIQTTTTRVSLERKPSPPPKYA